jgi:hypothetical protein
MKYIIFFTGIMLLSGCASTHKVPIDIETKKSLKDKSVAASVSNTKPELGVIRIGKSMRAESVLGTEGTKYAGKNIMNENNLEDPAILVSQALLKKLKEKYSVTVNANAPVVIDTDDIQKLAAKLPDLDFLIDVRTTNWFIGNYPTDWDRHKVNYRVKARLIDLKRGKVVAEGGCFRDPEKTVDAPTYDELLASKAARLKAELKKHAEECAQELSNELLT